MASPAALVSQLYPRHALLHLTHCNMRNIPVGKLASLSRLICLAMIVPHCLGYTETCL